MSVFPETDRQPQLDTPLLWADAVEKGLENIAEQ
jgi:hypothetical protein